jgi:CRISPR-associated protein (TIGR03986 family)
MTRPVHSNPSTERRTARAPYNFVPLPSEIVKAEQPPPQDRYDDDLFTGWFNCELETCSPVYVRGMVTLLEFAKADRKKAKELTPEEKEKRAPFCTDDPEGLPERQVEGRGAPMIPGSSLRGMLRTLVEIVGYGKMKWVNATPAITYRAVAAPREDPLAEPYRAVIGAFSRNVRAGYLEKGSDGCWHVWPAERPKDRGWPDESAYLKVKEKDILSGAITDFYRFNSPDYLPEYYLVSFGIKIITGMRGRRAIVHQIGDESAQYEHKGVLVCSGNMMETVIPDQSSQQKKHESPRRNHALVLPKKRNAKPLTISRELADAYCNSLTPFQKDDLWGKSESGQPQGVLEDGAPVFFVAHGERVDWFGHTPNFRIPALAPDSVGKKEKVATSNDFVPQLLRGGADPDFAEAIFGWAGEKIGDEASMREQCASRVSVSDARFAGAKSGVWYSPNPITPATLAGPKVTTFQHYLVQDRDLGHDPDDRKRLAHFIHHDTTEIRGHKLYWHKGETPPIEATADERKKESQMTRIIPLRPGVKFEFRIHFENLRREELGALAWALFLPGEPGKTYRHKIGLGKPLGLGAVAVTAQLHLTNRRARYQSLFSHGHFFAADEKKDAQEFITAFERFILDKGVAPQKRRLAEVERICMLLAMLQWRDGEGAWLDRTRYQLIEHETFDNEYKERRVLPDPLAVAKNHEP